MTNIESLELLKKRIAILVGELTKNELFGQLSTEKEARLKEALQEMRLLEHEICVEEGLKTDDTFDQNCTRIEKKSPRFKNSSTFQPIYKKTENPFISYMGHPEKPETLFTILPSVYVHCGDNVHEAIAYIRSNYQDLVLEKRPSERGDTEWELKLTNCYFKYLLELEKVDWLNIKPTEGYFEMVAELYADGDGFAIYGTPTTEFAAVFSFSNKSHLKQWVNFLKRGRTLSGESSFLAGAVVNVDFDVLIADRLCKKGKHQLFCMGLSLMQVESLLSFDLTSHVEDIDEHLFDYGCHLSYSERSDMVDFMAYQSNY